MQLKNFNVFFFFYLPKIILTFFYNGYEYLYNLYISRIVIMYRSALWGPQLTIFVRICALINQYVQNFLCIFQYTLFYAVQISQSSEIRGHYKHLC